MGSGQEINFDLVYGARTSQRLVPEQEINLYVRSKIIPELGSKQEGNTDDWSNNIPENGF